MPIRYKLATHVLVFIAASLWMVYRELYVFHPDLLSIFDLSIRA